MKSAISEVMETMFFTPVEFVGETPPHLRFHCRASIQLRQEPAAWEVSVCFVEAHARRITADFLAKTEEGVTGEEIADTLKEMANMIGGSFIFLGEREACKLGIPEFTRFSEDQRIDPQAGIPLFFDGELFALATLTPL